ncbi:MAG: hypothetical protein DLM68_11505, partial [Hyphomicrobiales bacterium]
MAPSTGALSARDPGRGRKDLAAKGAAISGRHFLAPGNMEKLGGLIVSTGISGPFAAMTASLSL